MVYVASMTQIPVESMQSRVEFNLLLGLRRFIRKRNLRGVESVTVVVAKINRFIQSTVRLDAAVMIYGALAIALLLLSGP